MGRMVYQLAAAGSSPRVRGKRAGDGAQPHVRGLIPARAGKTPLEYQRFRWVRLIPARAGKTSASRTMRRRGAAHPRACGENTTSAAPSALPRGSSPRVRGKPGAEQLHQGVGGLIPACAGKTELGPRGSVSREAHPRVCGENSTSARPRRINSGSSPRVRGKHGQAAQGQVEDGLIPACAGKTHSEPGPTRATRAHPRVCGENTVGVFLNAGWGAHPRVCGENYRLNSDPRHSHGSSPRVRGKPRGRSSSTSGCRLIPACAGKTNRWPESTNQPGAHPRVCGENLIRQPEVGRPRGSSPRVRGKPLRHRPPPRRRRLIPACAGKTGHAPPPRRGGRAHPRACGEN